MEHRPTHCYLNLGQQFCASTATVNNLKTKQINLLEAPSVAASCTQADAGSPDCFEIKTGKEMLQLTKKWQHLELEVAGN